MLSSLYVLSWQPADFKKIKPRKKINLIYKNKEENKQQRKSDFKDRKDEDRLGIINHIFDNKNSKEELRQFFKYNFRFWNLTNHDSMRMQFPFLIQLQTISSSDRQLIPNATGSWGTHGLCKRQATNGMGMWTLICSGAAVKAGVALVRVHGCCAPMGPHP